MKKFAEMSKKQKKDFFSNDFAERMIRVEQNVSASFNKPLTYNQTNIYKEMSPKQKVAFESYLKNKGRRKFLMALLLVMPIIIIAFLNLEFTGNIVRESLDSEKISFLSLIFIGAFGILIVFLLCFAIKKRIRAKLFKKDSQILERFISKKYSIKK